MIILGTNSIKAAGGFDVANSLRFNSGSSDSLNRSASAGNRKTFTISSWIKPSTTGYGVFFSGKSASTSYANVQFPNGSSKLQFTEYQNGDTINLETNRLFRDISAWWHVVIAVDTTQGTASNRIKLYLNGVQETSFATETYPSQNADTVFNSSSSTHRIGCNNDADGGFFNGYIAETVLIDGSQLAPDQFGEFDSDSGIWKPIDVSGLTFGTNGFYLDFENSGALGNDAAGSNNFTVNNLTAIDQSTDTCTNNFNTWLATDPRASNFTLSEGNLKIYRSGTVNPGQSVYAQSMMPTSGKWYVEAKIVDQPAGDTGRLGIANFESIPGNMIVTPQSSSPSSVNAVEVSFGTSGYVFFTINGSDTENSSAPGFSSGDIIMLAVDIDNGKFYVGSQGAWWNYSSSATGGDPTSGSGYVSNSSDLFNGSPICFHQGHSTGTSKTSSLEWNFGSPSFSISSGNTDGNGYGNFEYAVPSGYYSLNTKNLAEYG